MKIKKILKKGVHIISVPLSCETKLDDIFSHELANSFIEKLNQDSSYTKKEKIIFEDNQFKTTLLYKTIKPLETIRLTLKRAISINWEVEFNSDNNIKKCKVSKGFDKNKALQLIQLCSLIYEDKEQIKNKVFKQYKFDNFYYTSKKNHKNYTQGKIYKTLYTFFKSSYSIVDLQFMQLNRYDKVLDKELIVLVFQGSQESEDWLTNITFKMTKYFNKEKVHKGFYDTLKLFIKSISHRECLSYKKQKYILSKDIDFINNNCKILLTGHSLGGAIATLVGTYLSDIGIKKECMDVYTFGSPPVGSKAYTEKYNQKINLFRVINKNDIVPKIDKISSLKHLGKEIILASNENEIHSCNDYIDNLIDLGCDFELLT